LFDTPTKRHQPSRPHQQPANGVQQQSQPQQHQQPPQSASTLQNHRVAQIIQATGHSTSSPAFTNRYNSPAQNHFYASSAPTSTVALNQQANRPARPPVPLFTQSTGSIPQTTAKMSLEDLQGLEDFTGFEGGAPTSYSSPGMPAVYDLNASASSSTSNMGTVSPQDLLLQEPYMSAPNSTALTSLTSPSVYNESPEYNSYDVSPNFGTNDFDPNAGDPWFPLFPQQDATAQQLAPPAVDDRSPVENTEELDVVERTSTRRKSGNSHSPPSGRHSSVSGVSSRRRDKPLPPIVVEDPGDTVAMKRARNTLAARKSRERKAQRLEDLEEKIAKLEEERDHWKQIALGRG
jgi:general control protein GCN4